MEIRNLATEIRMANEAYAAKTKVKEDKLATGQKMTEQPAEAASLELTARGTVTEATLENMNAAASLAADVARADEMIWEANRRILEGADDSVLAQANQQTAVVSKLLD